MPYAEATKVSAERSQVEVEKLLIRHGATGYVRGWEGRHVQILFVLGNRRIRFVLQMPKETDDAIRLNSAGRRRTAEQARAAVAQEERRLWRALLLVLKAKFEAIESGITTQEDEFLPHTILPSGATVSEWLQPQVDAACASNKMPALLPGAPIALPEKL